MTADTPRPDERVEVARETLDSLASLGVERWTMSEGALVFGIARDLLAALDAERARAERAEKALSKLVESAAKMHADYPCDSYGNATMSEWVWADLEAARATLAAADAQREEGA